MNEEKFIPATLLILVPW